MRSEVMGILRLGVGMVTPDTGVMGVVIMGTRVMGVVIIMDVLTHITIHMVGIPMDGAGGVPAG